MKASGGKRVIFGALVLFEVLAVSSCIIYRTPRSYAGIPLKDVVANSGEPNEVTMLVDGRKIARYDWVDATASPGLPRFCKVDFIVDTKGVIESQDMSGNDCGVLRAKLRL
jgi:hypothetical protein